MFGTMSDYGTTLFDQLRRWDQEIDELFGATSAPTGIRWAAQGAYPPLNIGGSSESVDVYLFAAGLDPNSLELQLQQNLLTIGGERKPAAEEQVTFYRRERFAGSFQRAITLPEDVDPEQVEANYRNGILHVRLRRREAAKPRQIEVH